MRTDSTSYCKETLPRNGCDSTCGLFNKEGNSLIIQKILTEGVDICSAHMYAVGASSVSIARIKLSVFLGPLDTCIRDRSVCVYAQSTHQELLKIGFSEHTSPISVIVQVVFPNIFIWIRTQDTQKQQLKEI